MRPELHPISIHSPWFHVGIDFVGPILPQSESTKSSHHSSEPKSSHHSASKPSKSSNPTDEPEPPMHQTTKPTKPKSSHRSAKPTKLSNYIRASSELQASDIQNNQVLSPFIPTEVVPLFIKTKVIPPFNYTHQVIQPYRCTRDSKASDIQTHQVIPFFSHPTLGQSSKHHKVNEGTKNLAYKLRQRKVAKKAVVEAEVVDVTATNQRGNSKRKVLG